ncbi:EAL domain-containing protein [Chitinivorax sp. PXF-14]|uniref:putative bifunctional diguanylate cyclase/phosphodiesterase n=1 Tax=Chitinivorax sp. PXF-14 TaxID=3230488 RepID=UPI00346702DE
MSQPDDLEARVALLERRLQREREARKQAESLLNSKSLALFQAVQTSSESQRRLELAMWASGEGIWEWSAERDVLEVKRFQSDASVSTIPVMPFASSLEHVHADDQGALLLAWRLHLSGDTPDFDAAFRFLDLDKTRWIRMRGRAVERNHDGWATRVIGTVKDISRQRSSEASLRLMAHAFSSTREAMVIAASDWCIVEANAAFAGLIGRPISQLEGEHVRLDRFLPLGEFGTRLAQQTGWAGETRLTNARGEQIPVEVAVSPFRQSDSAPPQLIVTIRDVTERKVAARQLERLAKVDVLTQLPNRASFQQSLEQRLAQADEQTPFALLFLDLDGFKEVNDSFGHDAGDDILRQVSWKLLAALQPEDLLARWGGDEFVVMLAPGSDAALAIAAARRIIDTMTIPVKLGHNQLRVATSIGIATAPADGKDANTLLRRADSAMYAAKAAGRNRYALYSSELEEGTLRRVQISNQLRLDAEHGAFYFVAQPKVDGSGQIVSTELLIRWNTSDFGMVSPAYFIPLAEEIGVIGSIGRHAIDQAVKLAAWLHQQGIPLPVAVNLSSKQVLDPATEDYLVDTCQRHGVPAGLIELELTESALVSNLSVARHMLSRLEGRGFRLALDDFGTGYSSLSYLRELPFHTIKIDRSFVRDIDSPDPRPKALLSSIIYLADALNMRTVAEGVETASQHDMLAELGVNEFQGYHFFRPMALDDYKRQVAGN